MIRDGMNADLYGSKVHVAAVNYIHALFSPQNTLPN